MDKYTAELNKAIGKQIGIHRVADQTPKIRIRCVGYPESAAHYADAVVVSATSLVLSIDGVADTSFSGGTGTLLFATYTTLGTLIDEINSSAKWEAEIVAGLRSDRIDGSELLARSTSTFRMFEKVNIYADSSDNGVYKVGVLLEPNQDFEYVHGDAVQQSFQSHRVSLVRHRSSVNTNAGEATTITAYELKPEKASAFKTLGVWVGVDTTEKDSGQTDLPIVSADYGNSILIEVTSTGWIDTAAYLDVQGLLE